MLNLVEKGARTVELVTTQHVLQRALGAVTLADEVGKGGVKRANTGDPLRPQLGTVLALTGWPTSDEFPATESHVHTTSAEMRASL